MLGRDGTKSHRVRGFRLGRCCELQPSAMPASRAPAVILPFVGLVIACLWAYGVTGVDAAPAMTANKRGQNTTAKTPSTRPAIAAPLLVARPWLT